MSKQVRPPFDITLQAKRGIMKALYTLGTLPFVKEVTGRYMAPPNPALALQLGELLVAQPRRVLALTAHPDDLEYFAGGTLRRMALSGSEITAAVLTDGEKRGNWVDLAQQRQGEQRRAAEMQGYKAVRFFGLPDFGLPEEPRLEPLIARIWRETAPEVVLAFDPKELLPKMANRDHKALGRTVLDLARLHVHDGSAVYLYGTQHPNVLVDVGDVLSEKLRAVKAHRSQMVYLDERETDGAIKLMGEIASGASRAQYAEPLYRLL